MQDPFWYRDRLAGDLLPAYLRQRRWFGAKDEAITDLRVSQAVPLPGAEDLLLMELSVTTVSGRESYLLPLGILWEGQAQGPFTTATGLTEVERGGARGLLTDGFTLPGFAAAVIAALRDNRRAGPLRFIAAPGLDIAPDAAPKWLSAEQSNSSMVLGGRAVLKLLRKLQPGIHPDAEMVRHLTAQGFAHTPEILGEVWLEEGEPKLVMLLQRFVPNQGDGWGWTLDRLGAGEGLSAYADFAANFGARLAQMHQLLARPSADSAFAPRPMTPADAEALASRIGGQFDKAIRLLPADGEEAAFLRDHQAAIGERIRTVARGAAGRTQTRIHGDLHLGQVLVTGGDVMIIDFEGEPAKPLAERRAKDLPLRDVAGVLRSFDYAAAVAERAGTVPPDGGAAFREGATRAFLRGYGGAAGAAPLLDLFLLEKAAYEVAYEAANRPDWIGVPVAGLAAAARRLMKGAFA